MHQKDWKSIFLPKKIILGPTLASQARKDSDMKVNQPQLRRHLWGGVMNRLLTEMGFASWSGGRIKPSSHENGVCFMVLFSTGDSTGYNILIFNMLS